MPQFPLRMLFFILTLIPGALSAQPGSPLPPAPPEAISKLKVADGLEVQYVAAEPLVRKPVSITFDDRGRLWALQYLQYPHPNGLKPVEVDQYLRTVYDKVPEPPPNGPRGRDRITILEDTDHDGVADRSHDFLNELNLASGFALGYDGVFVAQPPYLLYYADKNHDDRPDGAPEVLLKGFGMQDAHAFANSLTWGPDGWLYGAQGSTVTANIRGIEFQHGIWRDHPRTKQFELFAEGGGNTWGIDFDEYGRLFAGGNTTEPLCHHVQGAYYIKGFGKHGPLHNPYSFGYFPPVKHVGFLGTALTGGCVIYQGGLLPDRFKNVVIYPNLRVNAMRVATLQPSGSTFETHFQEDLILSSDPWFRPADNLTGPDGAVYLADWCDNHIAHSSPKNITQWYQPHETGRIWRLVPQGTEHKLPANLKSELLPTSKLTSAQLVDLLSHPNAWYWREALRILGERRDPSVVPRLTDEVFSGLPAARSLRSLWALHLSGGLSDELAIRLLDHPDEQLRAWTIRLQGDQSQVSIAVQSKLQELSKSEPSPTVRSQLACTCKRLSGSVSLPITYELCRRSADVSDPHLPLLLWWAIEDKAVSDRQLTLQLFGSATSWNLPLVRTFIIERLIRRYLAEGQPADYAACSAIMSAAPETADREKLIQAMEVQMSGQQLKSAPPQLSEALEPLLKRDAPSSALVRLCLRLQIPGVLEIAAQRARDPKVAPGDRVEFIRTLSDLKAPDRLAMLLSLLQGEEPVVVHEAVLQALQTIVDDSVPVSILSRYSKLPPHLRDRAVDILVSRPAWSNLLLIAVEQNQISPKDVGLDQVRKILLHRDQSLSSRCEKFWGRVRPLSNNEKAGRIEAVSRLLNKGPGNAEAGKIQCQKLCLTCHQLFSEGQKVGPDLTAVDRKNLRVLLQNIVDPSSVIREGYGQYVVETKDGLILSGLIAESNAATITFLDAKNVRTVIPRDKIEEMKASEASLMPESLLDSLNDQEIRDLIKYLQSEPVAKPK